MTAHGPVGFSWATSQINGDGFFQRLRGVRGVMGHMGHGFNCTTATAYIAKLFGIDFIIGCIVMTVMLFYCSFSIVLIIIG